MSHSEQFESDGAERARVLQQAYDELRGVNSIVLRWDAQGRVLSLNDFGLRLFGYREEDILGRSVLGTIVAPVDAEGFDLDDMIHRLLQDPERYAFNENENVCRDGSRLWIAWRNTPIRDSAGDLTEILTVGVDITARKRAEEELRRTKDHLARALAEQAAVIEAIGDVFCVIDPTLRLVGSNARLQEVTGYQWEELRDQPLEFLFGEEEREIIIRQGQLSASHGMAGFLAHLQTKGGQRLPYEFNVRRSEQVGDGPVLLVAIGRDMTDRLRFEAQVLEAEKMTALTKLAASLLHELNTPLGVLRCNADSMQRCLERVHTVVTGAQCTGEQRRTMESLVAAMETSSQTTRQAIGRISALVMDLGAFVRLDASARGEYALHQELDRVARLVVKSGNGQIVVSKDYRCQQRLRGSPADLNQAFMKILTEAVEGLRGLGSIRLRTDTLGRWVRVRIEADDQSPHPRPVPRWGEPSIRHRGDRMAAGVGLFGAYHLIQQQGGEMTVEGGPHGEITFIVLLPRDAAAPDE